MFDLFTFLATRHLAVHSSRLLPAADAEASHQQLHAMMQADQGEDLGQGPAPEEMHLLTGYTNLDAQELESLPEEVQSWFLERFAIFGTPASDSREVAGRIARIYFLAQSDVQRYLTISALLAFDELSEMGQRSHAASIWEAIAADEGLPPHARGESLAKVADILLDQYFLSAQRSYSLHALRQLVQVARRDMEQLFPEVRGRIAARAEPLPENLRAPLLSLTQHLG